MKQQKELIPIFFSIDDGYAPYLGVALSSLIANASKEYDYRVIILYKELNDRNKEKIRNLATDCFEIQFVSMENRLDQITDRMENRLRCDYFTLTIYFRLFIPVMFPEYDKGIYLDSDIVVPGDISELYEVAIGDNLMGAARDYSIQNIPELVKYMNYGVGVGQEYYINSGVLLMNLKKMREVELERQFMTLLSTYHFDNIAPDQDYLNVICAGKIVYLPEYWDAMPQEGREPLKDPKLIHYNLFSKPWCYDHVPYEEYFWKYAKNSGYLEEAMQNKQNYSKEQMQSDRDSLALLLKRADQIADADFNFSTVFSREREILV